MGWSRPWKGLGRALCSVTAESESGWIYSLIRVLVVENFGSLWEEKSRPWDLGESLGLVFLKSPLAGEFQGSFVGRGFR